MKATELFLLVLLVTLTEQTITCQVTCLPWFIADNTSTTECSRHDSYPAVKCGSDVPLLRLGYCLRYNTSTETTEHGPCPYIAYYNNTGTVGVVVYIQMPSNVSTHELIK